MLKKGLKYLLFLPYFCIPVLYCYFWLNYTEQVRSFNPLAGSSIVPMELDKWVFGSLDMRLSLETWKALFIQLSNLTGNNVLLILPFIGMIFFKKNRANTIIFYAPLFVAMILFTNLYLIHDYYLYEVTSFFIFGIGLFIASLSQRRWGVFLQILTILISISLFLFSYFTNYYPVQTRRDDSYTQIGKLIEENTNKNDVILYFGFDWDPQIPYYSKRRAIVNVYSRVLEDSFIRSSLIHTGKDSIGGMVMKEYDPSGVKERIEFFGFNPEPVFRNKLGELYIRKR